MKVPSLQTLIVRALPSQSMSRHFVLAAAAHVTVLCGAASAQSAPAAPPLSLWNAVSITHSVPAETVAVVEHSAHLSLWHAAGAEVFGDGEPVLEFAPAAAAGQGFYRVKLETRPAAGKARWGLAGTRLLVNSSRGIRFLNFAAGGSGTETAGTTETAFTWEWRRTGRDEGLLTITLPKGKVEMMTLEFSAANAGVWTTDRLDNGAPAGAEKGTFRDETDSAVTPAAPEFPGSATVTFAGPGRKQCIRLAETSAHISSPAGGRDYAVMYSRTAPASATLLLSCQDGAVENCTLTFTGPACGVFEQVSELQGGLRRITSGAFTIAPAVD